MSDPITSKTRCGLKTEHKWLRCMEVQSGGDQKWSAISEIHLFVNHLPCLSKGGFSIFIFLFCFLFYFY